MECLTQAEGVVPSEDRFRVLFENAADPHFVIADGVIVDCNVATAAALGLASNAAVLQMRPSSLSPAVNRLGRRPPSWKR
jgi:PAS domain-containing protein